MLQQENSKRVTLLRVKIDEIQCQREKCMNVREFGYVYKTSVIAMQELVGLVLFHVQTVDTLDWIR